MLSTILSIIGVFYLIHIVAANLGFWFCMTPNEQWAYGKYAGLPWLAICRKLFGRWVPIRTWCDIEHQ